MDDTKAEPALDETVHEVQGSFPSDAALQEALGKLTLAGIDRANFSMPDDRDQTPDDAAPATDHIDQAQLRTMGSGMAGFAGAAAAAGATVLTGGAVGLAAAAAAAVGLGSGLAAHSAGQAAESVSQNEREEKAKQGKLVLAVRTPTPDRVDEVSRILKECGATEVTAVTRTDTALTAGISSASWTGA